MICDQIESGRVYSSWEWTAPITLTNKICIALGIKYFTFKYQ